MTCPFCVSNSYFASTHSALAFHDAFPLTTGHVLVAPRRHIASLFELTAEEQAEVWQFVGQVRATPAKQFSPAGFNIGINDGEAAGQTVPHAHIHVIQRYRGDVSDPRGGVRWFIPHKAAYWESCS